MNSICLKHATFSAFAKRSFFRCHANPFISCHSRSCYELVHSVLLVLCVIAVVIEIQVPVSCGEVAVVPGDIVVGDEEGVIVIPVRQPAPAGAVLPPDRGVQGYGGGVHTPRAGIP